MVRWLLAAPALALAAPVQAAEPVNRYPAPGMMIESCPASRDGLWALDPQVLQNDWAWLCRYREENEKIRADPHVVPRVVFIGDSITEGWIAADPGFFTNGIFDRGIAGQTSPQLLVRFWQDVVSLRPKVVHIMVGTNDIAGNTGPTSPQAYLNAVRSMMAIAEAKGIVVILGSIPPSSKFGWRPEIQPAELIAYLNAQLRGMAIDHDAVFADYVPVLAGPDGGLRPEFGPDGVHPNAAGYAAMRPVAERAIAAAEAIAAGGSAAEE